MDPISSIASVLALVGAAKQVAKGVNKLAALRGAPASILALNNELSDLRVVLAEVETLFTEHDNTQKIMKLSATLDRFIPIIEHTHTQLADLEAVERRITGTRRSGAIERLVWLWEQENINKIQKNLRNARVNIVTLLGITSLKSTFQIETRIEDIESATTNGTAAIIHCVNSQGQLLEKTSAQFNEGQQRYENHIKSVENLLSTRISEEKKPSASGEVKSIQQYSDSPGSIFENAQFSALRMRFLRRRKCDPWCACQCHTHTRFQSPPLLKSLFGQLFVGYSGLPAITGTCDLETCHGTSQSLIQVNYYFPAWFLSRAMTIALRTSEFQRPEYSLRVLNVRSNRDLIFLGAENNNADLVRSLIQSNKASVLDITSESGHSPLHLATGLSNVEVVKVLLEMGAEPYIENTTQETPYDMAWSTILCFEGTPQASAFRVNEMRALFPSLESLEERRRFTKIHKIVVGILHLDLEKELRRSRRLIDETDADGRTALSYAAARGDDKALSILIRYGANPNIVDRIGQGPLRQSMKAYESTCTTMLLNAGATVDHRDNWLQTALITTVFYSRPIMPFLATLLLAGADINAADISGSTTLMEAVKFNQADSVQFLLEHGADANLVDNFGLSAVMHGVRKNAHEALSALLDSDIPVIISNRDKSGKSVLHWASEVGDVKTLRILSSKLLTGLSVHDETDAGLTLIDIAEKRRKMDLDIGMNEKYGIDSDWMVAFGDLLDSIRMPTTPNSPKSLRSLGEKSDVSDDNFEEAIQHFKFEELAESVQTEGIVRRFTT